MNDIQEIRAALPKLQQGKTLNVPLLCEILFGLAAVAEETEERVRSSLHWDLSELERRIRSLEEERQD